MYFKRQRSYFNVLFLVYFLFIFPFNSDCQSIKIEVNSDYSETKAEILTLEEKGLLIFYPFNKIGMASRFQKWNFTRVDTSLAEIWSVEFQQVSDLKFEKSSKDSNNIYLLFTKQKEYKIVKIDINTGNTNILSGKLRFEDFIVNDFAANENYAVFGGSSSPTQSSLLYKTCLSVACFPLLLFPNFVPEKTGFLIHSNFNTKGSREIPITLKGYSEVVDIAFDNNSINMAITINSKKAAKHQVIIEDYKISGHKNRQISVKALDKNYLLSDVVLDNSKYNEKIIMGTFSTKNSNYKQGIYVSTISFGKQNNIKFTNFIDFDNFFKYLPKEDQLKITSKIERKTEHNHLFDLDYQWTFHKKIIGDSAGYITLAEAYYPQYHTEYTTAFFYGRLVEFANQVFDGYAYTHAVISAFDTNGNLLWDNYLPLDDLISFDLKEKVKIQKYQDTYLLAYATQQKVKYKYIKKGFPTEVQIAPFNLNLIESEKKELKPKTEIYIWYKNNLIEFSSIQKNQLSEGKGIKSIFILNKIKILNY
jgi:hypothetical protein